MENFPLVSVIMPVRNEARFIERSLRAVLSQDYPRDRIEILVADGMSEDETRAIIGQLQQQAKNLKIVNNPGKIVATGLNAALRLARGEIIVRVDGHCEIAPDYLRQCVSHILNDHVNAVGGPVETIGESYIARVTAAAMSSRFGVGGSAFRLPNSQTQFTDTVAFPAYTREIIDRAGPFDEELVRNQDDEYNYRLRGLGLKILLASDIRSRYYSRATLSGLWRQYLQYGYWKVRVMQKHPRQMQPRQFLPPLFVIAISLLLLSAPLLAAGKILLAAAVLAYAVLAIAGSIGPARETGWKVLPLLPLAFLIIHSAYGLGFLTGLLRFSNRWGDRKMTSNQSQPLKDVNPL